MSIVSTSISKIQVYQNIQCCRETFTALKAWQRRLHACFITFPPPDQGFQTDCFAHKTRRCDDEFLQGPHFCGRYICFRGQDRLLYKKSFQFESCLLTVSFQQSLLFCRRGCLPHCASPEADWKNNSQAFLACMIAADEMLGLCAA